MRCLKVLGERLMARESPQKELVVPQRREDGTESALLGVGHDRNRSFLGSGKLIAKRAGRVDVHGCPGEKRNVKLLLVHRFNF